jgi:dihydrofolate reductase
MIISAIVAMDDEGGVGLNNGLPWPRNQEDMDWFKGVTQGKTLIAGWRTAETLPSVVSSTLGRSLIVWDRSTSPEELLASIKVEETVIIGGRATYLAFLPHIQRFYISRIKGKYPADTTLKEFKIW